MSSTLANVQLSAPRLAGGTRRNWRNYYFFERERDRLCDFERLVCRFERGWFLTCTPERRASERPIAIACLRLLAFPLWRFILCICSRTYSPACVEEDFPDRLSAAARFLVVLVGINS